MPLPDDEGLNEDEDDSDSSRSPKTILNLTPVDPGISELFRSLVEHHQPEAIESDIQDQTEEDVAMEENIYSLPKSVSQRLSITDDLTSAQQKDNNEEER